MTENKLDSLETERAFHPRDKASCEGRRIEIEARLLRGESYSKIEKALSVSPNTIAKVSKNLVQRNAASEDSAREILRHRCLAVANRSLTKLAEGIDSEDDLKTVQAIFNSTYDKAVPKDNSGTAGTQVHISIANAFASPLTTATEATEEAQVTVDVTSEASDS